MAHPKDAVSNTPCKIKMSSTFRKRFFGTDQVQTLGLLLNIIIGYYEYFDLTLHKDIDWASHISIEPNFRSPNQMM